MSVKPTDTRGTKQGEMCKIWMGLCYRGITGAFGLGGVFWFSVGAS